MTRLLRTILQRAAVEAALHGHPTIQSEDLLIAAAETAPSLGLDALTLRQISETIGGRGSHIPPLEPRAARIVKTAERAPRGQNRARAVLRAIEQDQETIAHALLETYRRTGKAGRRST